MDAPDTVAVETIEPPTASTTLQILCPPSTATSASTPVDTSPPLSVQPLKPQILLSRAARPCYIPIPPTPFMPMRATPNNKDPAVHTPSPTARFDSPTSTCASWDQFKVWPEPGPSSLSNAELVAWAKGMTIRLGHHFDRNFDENMFSGKLPSPPLTSSEKEKGKSKRTVKKDGNGGDPETSRQKRKVRKKSRPVRRLTAKRAMEEYAAERAGNEALDIHMLIHEEDRRRCIAELDRLLAKAGVVEDFESDDLVSKVSALEEKVDSNRVDRGDRRQVMVSGRVANKGRVQCANKKDYIHVKLLKEAPGNPTREPRFGVTEAVDLYPKVEQSWDDLQPLLRGTLWRLDENGQLAEGRGTGRWMYRVYLSYERKWRRGLPFDWTIESESDYRKMVAMLKTEGLDATVILYQEAMKNFQREQENVERGYRNARHSLRIENWGLNHLVDDEGLPLLKDIEWARCVLPDLFRNTPRSNGDSPQRAVAGLVSEATYSRYTDPACRTTVDAMGNIIWSAKDEKLAEEVSKQEEDTEIPANKSEKKGRGCPRKTEVAKRANKVAAKARKNAADEAKAARTAEQKGEEEEEEEEDEATLLSEEAGEEGIAALGEQDEGLPVTPSPSTKTRAATRSKRTSKKRASSTRKKTTKTQTLAPSTTPQK